MKKRLAALLLAIMTIFLASCEKEFENVDEGFYDEDTGITYVTSNWSVQPINCEEVYAKFQNVSFYSIQFEEPTDFLSDFNENDIGFVYRNAELPDFTVESFNPVAALLYTPGENPLYSGRWNAEEQYLDESYQGQNVRDDSEYVYSVRDAIAGGEAVELPSLNLDEEYSIHIRLLSPDYPGLYYLIAFFRDYNGVNYLYDRGEKKAVICPENVLIGLFGAVIE